MKETDILFSELEIIINKISAQKQFGLGEKYLFRITYNWIINVN